MAKQLLRIADSAESEAVRLAAVRDALDRAGLRPPDKVDVEVGVKPYEELAGKIVGIATSTRSESRARRGVVEEPKAVGAGEIVDAEVVEDQEAAEQRPTRPTGMRTDESRGNPPGTGLMTMEEANRIAAEANRAAGVYDRRNGC
ncbi:hypothetical protein [Mycolicibacterium stellerae]|uniref:hypothetical protein n=1 Tax=Mycolicibacterium stellerae TaxID=2358193 RepID=UPI000F0B45EA|nr:hypothetical protein [Mycolicibacterium stellerae]